MKLKLNVRIAVFTFLYFSVSYFNKKALHRKFKYMQRTRMKNEILLLSINRSELSLLMWLQLINADIDLLTCLQLWMTKNCHCIGICGECLRCLRKTENENVFMRKPFCRDFVWKVCKSCLLFSLHRLLHRYLSVSCSKWADLFQTKYNTFQWVCEILWEAWEWWRWRTDTLTPNSLNAMWTWYGFISCAFLSLTYAWIGINRIAFRTAIVNNTSNWSASTHCIYWFSFISCIC